jgi:tRNA-splicing ligase RtcB (3'-phosphate/5'-hydroxy nucleic acid ligase)
MQTYPTVFSARQSVVRQGNAQWLLPIAGRQPVKLVANDAIFAGFDDKVFEQAVNTAEAPGVERVIVGPDGHAGYGCPVGSVVITDGMIYPGPVGPDICCSMSYLQTNIPDDAIADKVTRRALLNAIGERIPTGMGSRQGGKARKVSNDVLWDIPVYGASQGTLDRLGIPTHWGERLEAAQTGSIAALADRLMGHDARIKSKLEQIGSLGGGNHFAECQTAIVAPGMESLAAEWGIHSGQVGFLTHCGSRGFGFQLAARHFKGLEAHFSRWGIPLPGGERELVHAPVDSPEGQAYLLDMYLGANFAVVNHLLINAYIAEAFTEVLGPQVRAELVYHVSHNIGREEIVDGRKRWVFRKGATRAFPAGHHDLKATPFADTGHPILLPGNPEAGSYVMVGQAAGAATAYSINHGAGRAMGRNHAKRTLNQATVDAGMLAADILYNGRSYPIDEAPAAYKDFAQVTASIEEAGLAKVVAKLRARFVVKDGDQSAEGAA